MLVFLDDVIYTVSMPCMFTNSLDSYGTQYGTDSSDSLPIIFQNFAHTSSLSSVGKLGVFDDEIACPPLSNEHDTCCS